MKTEFIKKLQEQPVVKLNRTVVDYVSPLISVKKTSELCDPFEHPTRELMRFSITFGAEVWISGRADFDERTETQKRIIEDLCRTLYGDLHKELGEMWYLVNKVTDQDTRIALQEKLRILEYKFKP